MEISEILTLAGFDGGQFFFSDSFASSLRGPCPKCQGTRRMLVFVDRPLPFWNFQCDICGYSGKQIDGVFPNDMAVNYTPPEKPDLQKNLEILNETSGWIEYHNALSEQNREWLTERGVPTSYQDRWIMGYVASKGFFFKDELYYSDAYTIPKFDHDKKLVNIDYRLLTYPDGAGKYRSERGVPSAVFLSDPGKSDHSRLYVVEGSFKAAVLAIFLEKHGQPSQVVGLPGASSKLYREHVYQYPQVYILMDPDCTDITRSVSRETKSHPVFMPVKIDDAINGGMTWDEFNSAVINSKI